MEQSDSARSTPLTGAAAANLRAIVDIERQNLESRSVAQATTDRIMTVASSFPFVVFHVAWFSAWILFNTRSAHPFDPFPFTLLTMTVSLEAIMLTAFVLISQNHLTTMAHRRAHLDLQVNLLAERELTAILKAVCLISDKLGVDIRSCDSNLDELLGQTDVKELSKRVAEEL